MLWHKETNTRLESKQKIPLSEATLKKNGVDFLNSLGLIRPKQNPTANATRTLKSVQKKIIDTPVINDKHISILANEVNAEVQDTSTPVTEFPMREIRGLNENLQRIRGELISNLSKLTELV